MTVAVKVRSVRAAGHDRRRVRRGRFAGSSRPGAGSGRVDEDAPRDHRFGCGAGRIGGDRRRRHRCGGPDVALARRRGRTGRRHGLPAPVAVGPVGLERDDLREVLDRHARGLDEQRPDAVARRRARGHRTARENIADLVADGSFVEYGPLVIAAQRRRRSVDDLIASTPADGLVGGIGDVNADLFGDSRPHHQVRCRLLRLHGARRHAGNAEPSQEGPVVRGRRTVADPDRVLHRGRRRSPG